MSSSATMNKKCEYGKVLSRGLVIENPVLRLALGTCPTLAVSTSVQSALGMGFAATLVLICSNIVISSLRKLIPDKVRIPAFITIIASFVTIIQMLVKAYLPEIDTQLGVYLPLIVVNCIILGRAEAYASKNPIFLSAIDGLGMGIGFTAALALMGIIREFFGAGSILNFAIWPASIPPIVIFILPPGGFFVFGILVALANSLSKKYGMPPMEMNCCAGCINSASCGAAIKAVKDKKISSITSTSKKQNTSSQPSEATTKSVDGESTSDNREFADGFEQVKNNEFVDAHIIDLPEDLGPASSYDSVTDNVADNRGLSSDKNNLNNKGEEN